MSTTKDDIIVTTMETEQDFVEANECVSEAFGRQARDTVWQAMNPGWETEEGQKLNAQGLVMRWKATTTNKDGKPNTIFLKATVPDPEKQGERRVAGFAIWAQLSNVEGYGDKFTGDMTEPLSRLNTTESRFADQMFRSMWKRRNEYIKEVSESGRNPPAIFVLDICAVHPKFQRRGIAGRLVQYGLDEAKQRGNLECTTEGSAMGRRVYRKLGFKDEGVGDMVYEVDEEFQSRDKPPNIFLRTGL